MKTIAALILAIGLCASGAWANSIRESIEVHILTDDGRTLPTYPVKLRHSLKKVYAEAVKGDHYRIQVKNLLDRRVGLVIAVDGRNIISGDKSWLKSGERMYILEPFGSGEFTGWRSAQDRINRFYFTDVPDSYAAAFGDESAMGVIAVAAYPEQRRYEPPMPLSQPPASSYRRESGSDGVGAANRAVPAAPRAMEKKAARSQSLKSEAMDSAGTGYGREEYSPSYTVAFEPEAKAAETVYVKYEWRATLCRLGVISCEPPRHRLPNRLWDNGGYAPPPPGRS
jgi:hypothetical protein